MSPTVIIVVLIFINPPPACIVYLINMMGSYG